MHFTAFASPDLLQSLCVAAIAVIAGVSRFNDWRERSIRKRLEGTLGRSSCSNRALRAR